MNFARAVYVYSCVDKDRRCSMRRSRIAVVLGILLVAGLFAACDEERETQTDNQTISLEGAKDAEVEVRMGAGELTLKGATQAPLLEAAFRYNRERLRPEVDYRVAGSRGILRVGQRRRSGINFGRIHNKWDLRLTDAVPLDLNVRLGAGESKIDLRGLDVTALDINMGVGEMTLDLQGPHRKSFDVKIDGGVGSGHLYLPDDVGVRVRVDGGIGSVNARGMTKSGHVYTNEAYGKSPVTIDIEVDAGIGSIDLRVEPSGSVKF
jgi:hypothetical protein